MRWKVTYTKHFISGLLKGLAVQGQVVPFPTQAAAECFAAFLRTSSPAQPILDAGLSHLQEWYAGDVCVEED